MFTSRSGGPSTGGPLRTGRAGSDRAASVSSGRTLAGIITGCAFCSDSCSSCCSPPAAPTSSPAGWPGPPIEIGKPEKFVGAATPLEVDGRRRPARSSTALDDRRSSRTASSCRCSTPRRAAGRAGQAGRRRPACVVTREIGKQAVPELQSGAGAIIVTASRPVLYGIRTVAVDGDAATCRSGSSGRGCRSSRRITTSTTAAPRWWSTARRRTTSRPASSSATSSIPGYPGVGAARRRREDRRTRRVRVAFFALLHDQDLEHADPAVRARRGGQHRARRLRLPRLPEAVQEEPHRARRHASSTASCRRSSRARPR